MGYVHIQKSLIVENRKNKTKDWAVVEWSACLPSTLTIQVQIPLKPHASFCKICV